MPIVNRANYTECASCHRWIRKQPEALDGNRAFICDECFENTEYDKEREVNDDIPESPTRTTSGESKL